MNRQDSMVNLLESDEDDDNDNDQDGIKGLLHPKIRKYWKTFVVACLLLLFGVAFLIVGLYIQTCLRQQYRNEEGPNGYVFFICSGICLIPGVYHVVYIVRAAKGHKGYKMEDVTLFHE